MVTLHISRTRLLCQWRRRVVALAMRRHDSQTHSSTAKTPPCVSLGLKPEHAILKRTKGPSGFLDSSASVVVVRKEAVNE